MRSLLPYRYLPALAAAAAGGRRLAGGAARPGPALPCPGSTLCPRRGALRPPLPLPNRGSHPEAVVWRPGEHAWACRGACCVGAALKGAVAAAAGQRGSSGVLPSRGWRLAPRSLPTSPPFMPWCLL